MEATSGLGRAPVTDCLVQHMGAVGPLEFELVGAGQSNLTGGASGSFAWGPFELPGFADVDTLAGRYAAGSDRDVSDLGFFATFALWRLGCISHGVHERYRSGGLTHPPEPLAELARRPRELATLAAAALADST